MRFMDVRAIEIDGVPAVVSRSGYTGEDGFEISLPARDARDFAERLLAAPDVLPIGLGARDSLRLEAGLCLYGHDIDDDDDPGRGGARMGDPAGAPPRRRAGGRLPRRRGHPRPDRRGRARGAGSGSAPRAGRRCARAPSSSPTSDGAAVGTVTSGGFGPSLDAPVAMGYVPIGLAAPGTRLLGRLRGKMRLSQWRKCR